LTGRQLKRTAGAYPVWTSQEDALLLELCRDRIIRGDHGWNNISQHFSRRSMVAVRQRYLILRNRAAGVERDRHPKPRDGTKGRERRMPEPAYTPPPVVSHTSLTAAFFGDPLPGRSALDRRGVQS
jgi:hypothetical protein